MNITAILPRLQAVKKSGDGWTARCPAHDDKDPSLSIALGTDGRILLHCHANAGCTPETICAKLDLTLADLFPPKDARNGHAAKVPQLIQAYDYTDERGKLIFQVCRFDPKTFNQRRPDPARPGEWLWSMAGVERVLYNLPAVLKAKADGKPVFVAEGEKD
jgi:hypothetical protein